MQWITLKNAVFTTICISALFGILDVFFVGLTQDTNLFMHNALLVWNHRGLYTNFIQVNPPFNIVLYAPLAAFSLYAHLPPAIVLQSFAALLCIAGLASLNHALKVHNIVENDRKIWVAASAFLLFVPPTLFGVFADREHLLFALGLPWVIQMLLRLPPLAYTCLLFGIGCCMRPQDVLLFAALTLMAGPTGWLLLQRVFSYSSLIIASVLSLYVLCVIIFFPTYITNILPVAFIAYSAFQVSFFVKGKTALLWSSIVFYLLFRIIRVSSDRIAWGSFCLALHLLFLLNSGWLYTAYLIMAVPMVLLCVATWCSLYKEKLPPRNDEKIISFSVLIVILVMSSASMVKDIEATNSNGLSSHNHALSPELSASLRAAAGSQFILLSTQMWNIDIEPLGGKPESVFCLDGLWPLFWLFKHPQDARFNRVLHFITDPLVRAMNAHPSATIIVDTSPEFRLSPHSDPHIVEFLRKDLAVQTEFALYKKVDTIEFGVPGESSFCRFEIWKRR